MRDCDGDDTVLMNFEQFYDGDYLSRDYAAHLGRYVIGEDDRSSRAREKLSKIADNVSNEN